MNKHTISLAGGSRGWLALMTVLIGCAVPPARSPSKRAARVVRVVQAERRTRPVVIEVVGSVRAVHSATVASLISGTVAEVRVGLGSSVRAGDVLLRLSARDVDARLEQARAMSALATPERDRAINLRRQGAISQAQYDTEIAQWNVAQARQLEANAVSNRAVLRAPFAAVVAQKLANVGDAAMPGQALLVLEDPSAFQFEARVPETASSAGLAIGTSVAVRLEGLDRDILGTVAEIEPASDEATRTRLIKVALPWSAELRSGRFGRLLLPTGAFVAVTVPAQAVLRQGQLEGVFVVASGIARLRLVRSGREQGDRLEIASGLGGDEGVVVAGVADLVDGQQVEVAP